MKTDQELLAIFHQYVELANDETLDEEAKREARLKIGPDMTWDDYLQLRQISKDQRELADKKDAELQRMLHWCQD
jgi:hypothetical protein